MRKFIIAVIIIFGLQTSVSTINAAFGISPADITYENLTPGMTFTKEFLLSRTDLEKDLKIVVEPEIEGANNWIKIEPSLSFIIPKGEQTKKMNITITVPRDAPLKNYSGYITVKAMDVEREDGVAVVKGVGIAVNLITTKLEVSRLMVRQLQIPLVYQGKPLRLYIKAENQGNKKVAPEKVIITVYDMSGRELLRGEDSTFDNVEPGKTQDIFADIEHKLPEGEYVAEVNVIFENQSLRQEKIVFRVAAGTPESSSSASQKGSITRNILIISAVLISFTFVTLFLLRVIRRYKKRILRKDSHQR